MQRFHLGGARLDGVDVVAVGALLDHGAAQDRLGAGAPELHFHAVFLLEGVDSTRMSSAVTDE